MPQHVNQGPESSEPSLQLVAGSLGFIPFAGVLAASAVTIEYDPSSSLLLGLNAIRTAREDLDEAELVGYARKQAKQSLCLSVPQSAAKWITGGPGRGPVTKVVSPYVGGTNPKL